MLSIESNNVVWATDCYKHFVLMSTLYVFWWFTTAWCKTLVSLKICSNVREPCAFDMLCSELLFRRYLTLYYGFNTWLWTMHNCQLSNNKRRFHSRSVCYSLICLKPGFAPVSWLAEKIVLTMIYSMSSGVKPCCIMSLFISGWSLVLLVANIQLLKSYAYHSLAPFTSSGYMKQLSKIIKCNYT